MYSIRVVLLEYFFFVDKSKSVELQIEVQCLCWCNLCLLHFYDCSLCTPSALPATLVGALAVSSSRHLAVSLSRCLAAYIQSRPPPQ